ncbi:hypothetical protein E2K93_00730 [Thalassotalea sp. HSM 43]|uniref:hypothetical protein n=1 Tax=Thalassotalea sp. HSM 43 TaxID=2552945 RepID=UPI001080000D|nr:hypothetical protein [Thalassotalea sp. HSM 43]QBY02984.1 hypothetical protein E2K93_00730 [Thalassotalea sp. HSM 43]
MFNLLPPLMLCIVLFTTMNCIAKSPDDGNDDDWQLYEQQDQLLIEYKEEKNAPFITIRAEIIINRDIDLFYFQLTDASTVSRWLDSVDQCRFLQVNEQGQAMVYTRFAGFTLIASRHMITQTKITEQSKQHFVLHVEDVPSYPIDNSEHVQVTHVDVTWQAQQLTEQQLRVRYIGTMNPAGNLPAWLSNHQSLRSIKQSLLNLKNLRP